LRPFFRVSPTIWLTTKTVFSQVFALLLFAIQAPVLGPRAFGLVSIVMIFVGFCEAVPSEAVADSLISIRNIEDEHFDSVTTVNLGVSLLFGVFVFVGAETFAKLFGDPELASMLRWMSILPAISALAAAPTAATKRDMQFRPLALRSIGSIAVGGIVGLILTLAGAGVWALVWQALVTRLVATVVLWSAVPLKFRFGFSSRHLRELARYAAPTVLSRIMSWLASQTPRFILGLLWGATELGLFSLAARLSDLLMEVAVVPRYVVARVELRRFASDSIALADALRSIVTLMSVLCFPLCIGGAVIVPTLFHVWLDPRWYGAIIPTQLMLLTSMALITHYIAGATLLAANNQAAEAFASIVQTVTTLIVVLVSAPFGITVASAAMSGRPFALLALPISLLKRYCGLPARVMLRAQLPALTAALAMGTGVWLLRIQLETVLSSAILLPILAVAGVAIYAILIALLLPNLAGQFMRITSRRGIDTR
jgi:O-antigen/teichoic acid export membrane protein